MATTSRVEQSHTGGAKRSLRWAFAFYAAFCFIPVGMAAAAWFTP
jgi:hypothetical protein